MTEKRKLLSMTTEEIEDLQISTHLVLTEIRSSYHQLCIDAAKARDDYNDINDGLLLKADKTLKELEGIEKPTDKLREAWVGTNKDYCNAREKCHRLEASVEANAKIMESLRTELTSCMSMLKDRGNERQFSSFNEQLPREIRSKNLEVRDPFDRK